MRGHGVLGSAVALSVFALAVTAGGAAQVGQQVVLPGPVPYPTDNPPLLGRTPLPPAYLGPLLHISSTDRVVVGVDPDGRPMRVVAHQRLLVRGKGDYQLAISVPVEDVRAAAGSDSEPGLRTDQVLWAGFSPGRKVLAAKVTLRPRAAGKYLPVHLRLRREGDRVTLTVINTTPTAESLYAGTTHRAELAGLLDATRRASLAGQRLTGAYATFFGRVRVPKQKVPIEAPIRVEGELRLPGQAPVPFSRTLGDGSRSASGSKRTEAARRTCSSSLGRCRSSGCSARRAPRRGWTRSGADRSRPRSCFGACWRRACGSSAPTSTSRSSPTPTPTAAAARSTSTRPWRRARRGSRRRRAMAAAGPLGCWWLRSPSGRLPWPAAGSSSGRTADLRWGY